MSEEAKPKNKDDVNPQMRKVVRSPAANFSAYYTNNSEVGMTTYDLSIKFGRIEGADAENLYLQDQAIITMSLQHAKALAMILSSYIKQYEKDNGKLFVPFQAIPEADVESEKLPTSMYESKKRK